MPMGCPMSRIQPDASGSPDPVALKHTARVRSSHSGAPVGAGHRASAHQAAVARRRKPRAPRGHASCLRIISR